MAAARKPKAKGIKVAKAAYFRRKRWVGGIALVLICLISIGLALHHLHSRSTISQKQASSDKAGQPSTIGELLTLSPPELERCDIALIDLLCAQGLQGSEELAIPSCLETLDRWADYIKAETQRHEYRFREHPEDFKRSLGRYRMMMMGTVLAEDLGIHYDRDFALAQAAEMPITNGWEINSQLIFIHGLLMSNHVGTCASMPVLYVALGRRLGYPVSLGSTKMHLYAIYEEPHGEHFNIEATMTEGFLTPTDDDYKTGSFACTEEEIREYGWIRPLNNAGALCQCLFHRGIMLGNMKQYSEAKKVILQSARYGPATPMIRSNISLLVANFADAPLGDEIDELHKEVKSFPAPEGPMNAYFENRKMQVCYFIGDNTNRAGMEHAVADLKTELAQYRKELASDPDHPRYEVEPNILALTGKRGKTLRIGTAGLPPPLNGGEIPPGYLEILNYSDLENEGQVADKLWMHYKAINPHWMTEVSGLIRQR